MTRRSTFGYVLLVALALHSASNAGARAATIFSYTSSPMSYVGGGESVSVTPAENFDFYPSRNFAGGVSFWINDWIRNPDFWSQRWWFLDFAAPFGADLTPGQYNGATRFPFQEPSDPGLDFSGNGRGNNMLTGFFTVLEASYAANGDVLSFAVDFTQFDERNVAAWNRGSLRYNSDVPLTAVPEPSAMLLLGSAITLLSCGARRRRQTANAGAN